MRVPFLNLKQQFNNISTEIRKEIEDVLESTYFILGPKVEKFENDFSKMHNVKYCKGVSSGTDGNHLALWALGIKEGDEVIIPANTFIATAWGAVLCGAKPVFVDCEPKSYNLDPIKVEEAITEKTKAIVCVHLYGQPADMEKLKEISEKYNVPLIEDAAQAHLARYNNIPVGNFGELTSFSFYPGKNLGAYGEAGAVVTNNEDYNNLINMIRNQGQEKKYYHKVMGHNYRMSAIQAAVLNVKLKYIEKWTERRREIANLYKENLSHLEQIILPYEYENRKHVYHLFVIKLRDGIDRNKLISFLKENEIDTGLHYPIPLHLQDCFKYLGYKEGDFPETESLAKNCLSLPIFPEMSNDQVNFVSEKISEFFRS